MRRRSFLKGALATTAFLVFGASASASPAKLPALEPSTIMSEDAVRDEMLRRWGEVFRIEWAPDESYEEFRARLTARLTKPLSVGGRFSRV